MNNQMRYFLGLPKIEYGLKELPKEKEMEYVFTEQFIKELHARVKGLEDRERNLIDGMRQVNERITDYVKDTNSELEKLRNYCNTNDDRLSDQQPQLIKAKDNINILNDRINFLHSRLNELQTQINNVEPPVEQQVKVNLGSFTEYGEIIRIDERSLVIDEIRQKLISLRKKKEDTKKGYESEERNNQRHPDHSNMMYHEINALNEVDRLIQTMIGDNPILVTRKGNK